MTYEERIEAVNRALDRCDARSRKDGQIRWSLAICILCGVKARLIRESVEEMTGGAK